MGVIEREVPEGIPLKPLKKKIDELVKEEEAGLVAHTNILISALIKDYSNLEAANDGESNDDIKNFKPQSRQ